MGNEVDEIRLCRLCGGILTTQASLALGVCGRCLLDSSKWQERALPWPSYGGERKLDAQVPSPE